MMSFSPLNVAIGVLGGLVLSAVYFGGLWLSVQWIRKMKWKKLFLFLSWVLRSVLLCAGLYALALYNSACLLCGAISLLIGRSVIIGLVKRKNSKEEKAKEK